jgi:hypothetical protein
MDYEELKSMWEKYDSKLDNLEKMNKKIILETLLTKPRKKLKWFRFRNIYNLIAVPVILMIVVSPNLKPENFDIKFLIGSLFVLGVIIYITYLQFKSYLVLKQINFDTDSVMESAAKINKFKSLYNSRWKHAVIYYPIIYSGFILIGWNSFYFSTGNIAFLVALFIITYAINIRVPKLYRDRIQRLEKDIVNLKEYAA